MEYNLKFSEFVSMTKLTTFRMGPKARYYCVIKSVPELREAYGFAKEHNLPVLVLGSGSNIILSQPKVLDALVIKIIKVGAGEIWDDVVKRSVDMNLWGIEAMSWIPGTAGATPIQNVGAYGTEIADVLFCLEVFDPVTGEV